MSRGFESHRLRQEQHPAGCCFLFLRQTMQGLQGGIRTARARCFASRRLRQVSLLNFTLGSDFFIAALQNFDAFLIGISPLFSSSDFRVRYKSYQQINQKAIHQITQTRAHLFLCLIICIFSIGNSHRNIKVFSHQQISA